MDKTYCRYCEAETAEKAFWDGETFEDREETELFYTGDFHLDLLSGHIFSEPDSIIKPMEVFTRIDDDKLRLGVCSPDGTECILEKRLQINFCPMCGRKLKPARGKKIYMKPEPFLFTDVHKARDFWFELRDIMNEYSYVTLGDAYALITVTPDIPDYNYGWDELPCEIPLETIQRPDGVEVYAINLPVFNWEAIDNDMV